jgi:hypothetical protein
MAILNYGITGPFIGRVGPVVGYMWKGIHCVRSYVEHIRYPNTESQQQERSWFVSMVRFAAAARPALKLGLRRHAKEGNMTESNYFVMMNKQHFTRGAEGVTVDYSRLNISFGSAADVYFHEARFEEGETVAVDFEKNRLQLRASGEDNVYLYVYAPGLGQGCLSAPTPRRQKTVRLKLPSWWAGQEVHLYGFVVDREGRPSNTTYIGVGRVNHYEERGRYIPLNKNWNDFVEIATEANTESGTPTDVTPTETIGVRHPVDLFGDPPEVP